MQNLPHRIAYCRLNLIAVADDEDVARASRPEIRKHETLEEYRIEGICQEKRPSEGTLAAEEAGLHAAVPPDNTFSARASTMSPSAVEPLASMSPSCCI